MEITIPDVSGHPVILYVTVFLMAGWIVATIFPQITGKFQDAVKQTTANRRAAAADADDADIADLTRERNYLAGVAAERLRELQARDRLIAAHMVWDRERYNAAISAGHDIRPAPPLHPELPPFDLDHYNDGHPT